jgi:hypothetical protein
VSQNLDRVQSSHVMKPQALREYSRPDVHKFPNADVLQLEPEVYAAVSGSDSHAEI